MPAYIHIGTSGYNYPHWGDGVFYPAETPKARWLEHYARHFGSVELNVTFYRLPDRSVFQSWRARTPSPFTFAIKGNRYITHIKRLKDCREPVIRFMRNASALREKLQVVLWQLHPGMRADLARLDAFCKLLRTSARAGRVRHAFEFRHESWFCEGVYNLLRTRNHALCIAHSPDWPMAEIATADFVYLRFHGGELLYGSNYSGEELDGWAAKIRAWIKRGIDVYAYFNNDARGFAAKNALFLRELVVSGKKRLKTRPSAAGLPRQGRPLAS
jgi:uncharacterized protein YecE (DUF72 family)